VTQTEVEADPYADTWWDRWHEAGEATRPRLPRHRRRDQARRTRHRWRAPRPRTLLLLACVAAFLVSFSVDVLVHPLPDPMVASEGN
jgi:hypothetical protein